MGRQYVIRGRRREAPSISILDITHTSHPRLPIYFRSRKTEVKVCGNRVTAREYQHHVTIESGSKVTRPAVNPRPPETEESIRARSVNRTKKNFRDIVDSNFSLLQFEKKKLYERGWRIRFLTLTYRKNNEDRKILATDFDRFMKRLKSYLVRSGACRKLELKELRYIAVPEIQKKREKRTGYAVWHLHVLIFSPYVGVRRLYRLWRKGATMPKLVKEKSLNRVGGYMTKYLVKDMNSSTSEKWKKRYFSSQGLRKAKIVVLKENVNLDRTLKMFNGLVAEEYEWSFSGEWVGDVKGKTLYLKRTFETFRFLNFFLKPY